VLPFRLASNLAQALPFGIAGYGDNTPAVLALAWVGAVRRHMRIAIALSLHGAAIDRIVQQRWRQTVQASL
jgi:hypothetical protein